MYNILLFCVIDYEIISYYSIKKCKKKVVKEEGRGKLRGEGDIEKERMQLVAVNFSHCSKTIKQLIPKNLFIIILKPV